MSQDPDTIAWPFNTDRVLLTRARFDAIIWVPRGDADDPGRGPAVFDRVAACLGACGVRTPAEPPAGPVMAMTGRERLFA